MYDPNIDYSFFKYPVYYQQQNGYLVFSCPDLNIAMVTSLPYKKRFDKKYAIKLVQIMGQMEVKIRKKIAARRKARIIVPSPSSLKKSLSGKKVKRLTAPQVAEILGKSADTVRRMADRGEIPCHKTNGGTRYFFEKDII